jgi:hypothetical protein
MVDDLPAPAGQLSSNVGRQVAIESWFDLKDKDGFLIFQGQDRW